MEQSATPESRLRISWLAILSFIFSLAPLVSGVFAIRGEISTILIFLLAFGGFGVSMALKFLTPKSYVKVRGFDVFSIVTAVSLMLLWMMCVPGAVRMKQREKESTVKQFAHTFQLSIEDYIEKHYGERPKSVRDVEFSPPVFAKNVGNPFNPKQTYTALGGGFVDGEPKENGQVGYIAPGTASEPYRIVAFGADHGKPVIILELIEELSKVKPDSGVTKGP